MHQLPPPEVHLTLAVRVLASSGNMRDSLYMAHWMPSHAILELLYNVLHAIISNFLSSVLQPATPVNTDLAQRLSRFSPFDTAIGFRARHSRNRSVSNPCCSQIACICASD